MSSNGDGYFDVHYRPDYQAQQKAWRAALKADPHATVADSEDLQYAGALTRRVVVADSATGVQQTKTWVVNPFTRQVIGVRYRYYKLFSTTAFLAPRDVPYVWLLSHVLDTALAGRQPRVTVQDAMYRGRPAESATLFNGDGKPAYEALIDRQYGVAEQVASLQGSRTLPTGWLAPYHLEDLQVNRPISQSRFVMKPDYRYAPQGLRPAQADRHARQVRHRHRQAASASSGPGPLHLVLDPPAHLAAGRLPPGFGGGRPTGSSSG